MNFEIGERILVLGGSRGLGAALVELLRQENLTAESMSRKSEMKADFAKSEAWNQVFQKIQNYDPTRIIYSAAGGPYGAFDKFQWKDHAWSLKVTFEFPAALIHFLTQNKFSNLKQVIMVGSAIAESQPDPGAAAYCAAKHALRGLVTTLQKENLTFDLRLLSPGYVATDLLPADSAPRTQGLARDPFKIAALMIQSISDPALKLKNQSFD
jgi:short-subunit dehydrogenase